MPDHAPAHSPPATPSATEGQEWAVLIARRVLVASEDFTAKLSAASVAAAIARGLRAGGMPEPDLCPLAGPELTGTELRALLDSLAFDGRMRACRAVIVAAAGLHERTLDGSVAFEIATRARQAGVPVYGVTGENELDAFDTRILDLQRILVAQSTRALTAAGRSLAAII